MLPKLKKNLQNHKGFTLIELIIVIAIIAILAAVLIPRFIGFTEDARQKSAVSDTRNILLAVDALLSQGDTSITKDDIEKFMGKAIPTTNTIATLPLSDDTFTYTVVINSTTYVVDVASGVIDDTFVKAEASATGSTSTGIK